MIRRIIGEVASIPGLINVGLCFFALGTVLDLVYHAAPPTWVPTLDIYLGRQGAMPHLITLLGIVTTLAGLAAAGLAARRRPMRARFKEDTEAESMIHIW